MSIEAREYYSKIINTIDEGPLEMQCIVHCDVFGTLLKDFSDEPILNKPLSEFLNWLSGQGFDVEIVSSAPDAATSLLEKTDISNCFLPVADKKNYAKSKEKSMALLIDDQASSFEKRYGMVCNPNDDEFKDFLSVFEKTEIQSSPELTKRMIVIDDDLARWVNVDNLFKTSKIPVEVIHAGWSGDAIEQVNEWLDKGYKIDAITCDDNRLAFGHSEHADQALTAVLQHIEDRNPELLPDQLFVHSKGASMHPDLKWGETISIDTMELHAIANDIDYNDPIFGFRGTDGDHYNRTVLRQWCNENWGTGFVVSKNEAKFLSEPDEKLSLSQISELIFDGVSDARLLFDRFDVDSMVSGQDFVELSVRSELHSDLHNSEIKFKDATGDAVVGRLAFDLEDIQRLKAEDMHAPITLCISDYDPSIISLLPSVNGVILLGEGSEHFKLVLENAGISGVLTLDDRYHEGKSLTLDGKSLVYVKHTYNHESEEFDPETIILKAGDHISTATNIYRQSISYSYAETEWETVTEGHFYPCEMPLSSSPETHLDYDGEYTSALVRAADNLRKENSHLNLMVNADTPEQIDYAISAKADGVGLIRSEHMFYNPDRLELLQLAFMADDEGQRASAFSILQTMHTEDILGLIQSAQKAEHDFPLTFRLMDAPLDEFLLHDQKEQVISRVGKENTRGVQFANQTSGLYEMQVQALKDAMDQTGYAEAIRIMIPNIRTAEETSNMKSMISNLMDKKPFEFGVMIEALDAVENIQSIAQQCDFMSFGTNDLTAEVMENVNRIDYDAISKWMIDNNIQGETPFKQLVPQVVHQMQKAVDGARRVNPNIHISACGQQMAIDPKACEIALSMNFNGISVPNRKLHSARLMSAYHANKNRNLLKETSIKKGQKVSKQSSGLVL